MVFNSGVPCLSGARVPRLNRGAGMAQRSAFPRLRAVGSRCLVFNSGVPCLSGARVPRLNRGAGMVQLKMFGINCTHPFRGKGAPAQSDLSIRSLYLIQLVPGTKWCILLHLVPGTVVEFTVNRNYQIAVTLKRSECTSDRGGSCEA